VSQPARRRGRYLEAQRNDLLVLQAAREVFATLGADAPVAAVAERAGVGVGSLYRRYGSKTELLQRLCVLAMQEAASAAEVALGAEDAWTGLAGYISSAEPAAS
jgi:AcrR family transcriptional regulator